MKIIWFQKSEEKGVSRKRTLHLDSIKILESTLKMFQIQHQGSHLHWRDIFLVIRDAYQRQISKTQAWGSFSCLQVCIWRVEFLYIASGIDCWCSSPMNTAWNEVLLPSVAIYRGLQRHIFFYHLENNLTLFPSTKTFFKIGEGILYQRGIKITMSVQEKIKVNGNHILDVISICIFHVLFNVPAKAILTNYAAW